MKKTFSTGWTFNSLKSILFTSTWATRAPGSKHGPTYITLRGQGGEEIAIGVVDAVGVTLVTATSYLFDQQVARFLASLPVADEVLA